MKQIIEFLRKLHSLDTECLARTERINQMKKEIEVKRQELEKLGERLEELRRESDEKENQRVEMEGRLKDEEKNIRMWDGRLREIKKQREYQAMLMEIQEAKKAKSQLEDEILKLLDEQDNLKKEINELEERFKNEDTEFRKMESDFSEMIRKDEEEVKKLLEKREKVLEWLREVDADIAEKYETIRERNEGKALSSVKGGVCEVCCMSVPPEIYNEAIKGDKIVFCPNCQSILYRE